MQIPNNIHIACGAMQDQQLFSKYIATEKVAIVTDTNVAELYLDKLLVTLAVYEVHVITLEPGEINKNWQAIEKILHVLWQLQFTRDATLISLGGGVVGDLAGFAAAIYMRGINWVQFPTTLLAQVDAAFGGKTACNFFGIKNLIGTFYFPRAVVIDLDCLRTLSAREYSAGLAESLKYGMACDAVFFRWLEQQHAAIRQRDPATLRYLIGRCCEIKHSIVALDRCDQQQRMALNFGHCFGHAIEAATNFSYYLHGEAVALGMLLAARLAVKIGILEQEILDRLRNLLVYLGLPIRDFQSVLATTLSDLDVLYSYICQDKKRRAGLQNIILPCALGEVTVFNGLNKQCLEELLQSHADNELFS